jgi:hypothetical protein
MMMSFQSAITNSSFFTRITKKTGALVDSEIKGQQCILIHRIIEAVLPEVSQNLPNVKKAAVLSGMIIIFKGNGKSVLLDKAVGDHRQVPGIPT